MEIEKLAVFSGSRIGNDPAYKEASEYLADIIYKRGISLVYGGGRMGLMGIVSERLFNLGGNIIGVVPELFRNEKDPDLVSELIKVGNMSERKDMMLDLSDASIVLPGGIGTIDEYSQAIVYKQLGLNDKPSIVLNINGIYDNLEREIDCLIANRFIEPEEKDLFLFATSVDEAFEILDRL